MKLSPTEQVDVLSEFGLTWETPRGEFWPFEKAREFARGLSLTGVSAERAWSDYIRANPHPNLPLHPDAAYVGQGWKGLRDWVGWPAFGEYWTLDEAKEYIHKLNLKASSPHKAWKSFCKSGNRPAGIPGNPYVVYGDDFCGMRDFLGWGDKWLSFEEAKDAVRSLGIKGTNGQEIWKQMSKKGNIPEGVPTVPWLVYKDEWNGFDDWFGREEHQFPDFADAQKIVSSLKLSGTNANDVWRDFCKASLHRSLNLPYCPEKQYQGKGWNGYRDWLGWDDGRMMSYAEARDFVRSLYKDGLIQGDNLIDAWREYVGSNVIPHRMSRDPEGYYRKSGEWEGWPSFFGVVKWIPFDDARKFSRSLGLKGKNMWRAWKKWHSDNQTKGIPYDPSCVYEEWNGIRDWLGLEVLPFGDARDYVRSLGLTGGGHKERRESWKGWVGSDSYDPRIPANPKAAYEEWTGMCDWFGESPCVAWHPQTILDFEDARDLVVSMNLQGDNAAIEWENACRLGIVPAGVPHAPSGVYRDKGWKGLRDWLGWPEVNFLSFSQAREAVRNLHIPRVSGKKPRAVWNSYKANGLPDGVPRAPEKVYQGRFAGYCDWMGWEARAA